jgi:transposase-like protein
MQTTGGYRKHKVRELFNTQGVEAAWVLGRKLGLKQSSLRVWFNQWKREGKASKKAKPATKPAATIQSPSDLGGLSIAMSKSVRIGSNRV